MGHGSIFSSVSLLTYDGSWPIDRANRDMARDGLHFGVYRSFAIACSYYENIDLATMSQCFMPVYTNTKLDDIEKEVAPLAHDLSAKIEDEITPLRG